MEYGQLILSIRVESKDLIIGITDWMPISGGILCGFQGWLRSKCKSNAQDIVEYLHGSCSPTCPTVILSVGTAEVGSIDDINETITFERKMRCGEAEEDLQRKPDLYTHEDVPATMTTSPSPSNSVRKLVECNHTDGFLDDYMSILETSKVNVTEKYSVTTFDIKNVAESKMKFASLLCTTLEFSGTNAPVSC